MVAEARLQPGAKHACELEITDDVVTAYAALSGDDNPLHMDLASARRLGFPRRVAHGGIVLSEISRILGTVLPGRGSLWLGSEIEFRAPVYVGETVELDLEVVHVSGAVDIVLVEIQARRKSDGAVALEGTAKVRVLNESKPMHYVPLEEQRVVVTGGTRGLGEYVSRTLVEAGASVVAVYRQDEDGADALAGELGRDRFDTRRCDVTDSAAVRSLFDEIGPGPVHGFVHAATPRIEDVPFAELEWATVQGFLETYVKAALEITQHLVPRFRDAGCGRVVLVGSEAAEAPRKHWTHYVTAKSAMTGLVRGLAVELADIPATANLVSPGLLHSSDALADNVKSMTRNATPLKRLVTGEEVAEIVAFLLGKGGSFLNGANLPLTGGRVFF